jgi:hypothetical protein
MVASDQLRVMCPGEPLERSQREALERYDAPTRADRTTEGVGEA